MHQNKFLLTIMRSGSSTSICVSKQVYTASIRYDCILPMTVSTQSVEKGVVTKIMDLTSVLLLKP
jgi:hypothetical protein